VLFAPIQFGGSGSAARVITQFAYHAYGSVVGSKDPASPSTGTPEPRVGYKGLFFDRLDGGNLNASTGADTPRLVPGARLLGYARNRTLMPDFGRWLQPDPNGAAIPLQSMTFHGSAWPGLPIPTFDVQTYITDGPLVTPYARSNPLAVGDPHGLFGFIDGLSTGMDFADMASDAMEQALDGVSLALRTHMWLTSRIALQEADIDWASDWSLSDEGASFSQSFDLGIGVWSDEDQATSEAAGGQERAGIRRSAATNAIKYAQNRSRWSSVTRHLWKQEARSGSKLTSWSEADLQRTRQGLRPKGWVIHHRKPLAHGGSNSLRNMVVMPESMHTDLFGAIHTPPYSVPGFQSPRGPRGPKIVPRR